MENNPESLYPSDHSWIEENNQICLIGNRCLNCNKTMFPTKNYCDNCGNSENFEELKVSHTGSLYSYTEVHVAPKEFEVPFIVGYVDFPEDVRIFGQIDGEMDDLSLNDTMVTVLGIIRHDDNGGNIISYKFRKKDVANA